MFKMMKISGLLSGLLMACIILLSGCAGNEDTQTPASVPTNALNPATMATDSGKPTVSSTEVPAPSTQLSVSSTQTPLPSVSASTPTTTVSPVASEIAARSVTMAKDIQTLKFDMDFEMVFGLGMGENAETMNMHETAKAAVNVPDKKMAMTMDMLMDIAQEEPQNMSAEIYLVDGWMYMKANVPEMGEQWSKMELTDELWAQQSQISSMTDFLKSPLNLESAEVETIRGIDCYVLNISPNEETLANWMAGQMQSGEGDFSPDDMGISQMFQNFTVKEWIAKDTYLPVRQQIAMKFDRASVEPQATPNLLDQMAMEIKATIDYYDYNQAVNIQLPPEALNAQELMQEE
jgi:hypothetical protein